ncbi:MBL fold metallo-hydrolase [Nostoc sp. 3335mG]|nr:MBL fold metallo-hydrolase [Nostoc sp. 3335mG]
MTFFAFAAALALTAPTDAAPLSVAPAAAPRPVAAAEVKLWRVDCGSLHFANFAPFSDRGEYDGQPHDLIASCYLIKHGDEWMLWDTGLGGSLVGKPSESEGTVSRLDETIATQIVRLGVTPAQVKFVGISHNHFDHIGQAADFPASTLLIGKADFDKLAAGKADGQREAIAPWLGEGTKIVKLSGDHDVFGDGSVTILSMPGHTAGHAALLVRVTGGAPVLLSGDQFHAQQSFDRNLVPVFNADRAQTLTSSDRFRAVAAQEKAVIVIQHEPADLAKIPAIPKAK